jgi:uncharacterized protein (DUF1330 family)
MPPDALSPVYLIALFRVPDVDSYRREYGRKVLAQVMAAGGKLLVASPSPTILEGEWDPSWTAVIQFPDRATAMRWYQSNEYAPLKKLRVEELTTGGTVALFDGYQPPAAAS